MSGQITTYVLNLDRSVDRWQAISDRLSALNIPFVRVPAVDGRTLRLADHVDDAACRRYMGRSMHQGELGCTLGHRLALQRFLDYIGQHERVWVCRRLDIARHWREV